MQNRKANLALWSHVTLAQEMSPHGAIGHLAWPLFVCGNVQVACKGM